MRDKITCCKGCEDRHVGCHAKCDIYKDEKAEHDQFLAKKKADREIRSYFNEQNEMIQDKITKHKKKRGNCYNHGKNNM